jgi:hypothetical protein
MLSSQSRNKNMQNLDQRNATHARYYPSKPPANPNSDENSLTEEDG